MLHVTTRRARRTAAVGVLTLALTAGLATWPWDRDDVPEAEAQEPTTANDGVADTEGEALAEAEASGESVEVLSLRSEQRDVHAEPDGTFMATEYAAPVRTMIDGAWVAIDPTLVEHASGSITPKATAVQLVFSAGGSEPLVTLVNGEHIMTLDWPGDLPEPSLEGDTAVYPEVLPGVDLRLTALDAGFTHTLVVKSAEAAANPELASIEWPVTLDGAEVETTPEGGLSVVDTDTLDAWLSTDSPTMWDSSGVAEASASVPYLENLDLDDPETAQQIAAEFGAKASVGISGSGSAIVLTPDMDLLTGDDTVYPVYIDPVYKDESRSAWAMIATNYPDQEYWNWSNDGGEGVGTWVDGGPKKRQLFRVPTSFYKGKQIVKAEFAVSVTYNWFSDQHETGYDIHLDKVSGFSSSTNWNNRPSYSQIATADAPKPINGVCKTPTDGAAFAMEWGITSTLQSAANAGTSTLSFQVRNYDETEEERWIRICNNGQLRVQYNTPPDVPLMSNMWTSTSDVCQWEIDPAHSYTNVLPVLYTVAYDDDHKVKNEWGGDAGTGFAEKVRVQWQLTNTADAVIYTSALSAEKDSGSTFQLNLAAIAAVQNAVKTGAEVRWQARATDNGGTTYTEWSSLGAASRCRFIYDASTPSSPLIASTDFPASVTSDDATEDVIVPMLGEVGSLTLSTGETDIVAYSYDFNKDSAAGKRIDLDTVSAPATITFMPTVPGSQVLTVTGFDAAGNSSKATYTFRVSASAPKGAWALGDAAGSATAIDSAGTHPGTRGAGVTFGNPGPGLETAAAHFDGSTAAYIDNSAYNLAPTGKGVTLSAWAKVDNLAKDGVVASIDGGLGESALTLGYRSTSATTGTWVLSMPDMAMGAFTAWEVTNGTVTTTSADEWVHLIGVWNDATGQLTLYVNGDLKTAKSTARQTIWWGDGTVQIGRANSGGSWDDNFTGDIADVRVYDRVVPSVEAEDLGWRSAIRAGYWQFNTSGTDETTGVLTSPEYDGATGLDARLNGGAAVYVAPGVEEDPLGQYKALVGAGHLALDGVNDYASLATPVVNTARSYSVTAHVKLSTAQPSKSMTVLSIPTTTKSALEVGYNVATGKWEMRLAANDPTTGAPTAAVSSAVPPTAETQGQSIAVVVDGLTGQAWLYVDGVASAPLAIAVESLTTATGGVQIGRGASSGTYNDYFAGVIDEVRLYAGILHESAIGSLHVASSTGIEQPQI